MDKNIDQKLVEDFGNEWLAFDQQELSRKAKERQFLEYFEIFPWQRVDENSVGFDAGCGSGRWAEFVAERVGHLHCVEPSAALRVAQSNLSGRPNCSFHNVSIGEMPFPEGSMDFGYCLGVLHHLPDPAKGLSDCVRPLKVGAPMLIYFYYALENQPGWFRALWRLTDGIRRIVSKLPRPAKLAVSQLIALFIYYPMARMALLVEKLGVKVHSWPLSAYRHRPFYMMRTDALDRFGTRIEWRYTKREIEYLMTSVGLIDVKFNSGRPFYCAVGYKSG